MMSASSTRSGKSQFNLDEFRRSYAGLTPAAAVEVTAKRMREAQSAALRKERRARTNFKIKPGKAKSSLPDKDQAVLAPSDPGIAVRSQEKSGAPAVVTGVPSVAPKKRGRRPNKGNATPTLPGLEHKEEEGHLRAALQAAEDTVRDLTVRLRENESSSQKLGVVVIESDELKKALSVKKAEVGALEGELARARSETDRLRDQLEDLQAQLKMHATVEKGARRSKPEIVSVGRAGRTVTVIKGQTIAPRSGKLTLKGVSPKVVASVKEKLAPKDVPQKAQDKGLHSQSQRLVTLLEMTLMGVDPETSNASVCERAIRGLEQVKYSLDKLTLSLMGRAAVA